VAGHLPISVVLLGVLLAARAFSVQDELHARFRRSSAMGKSSRLKLVVVFHSSPSL